MTGGRLTEYKQEVADKICLLLAEGQSLRAICRSDELPPESTVRTWVIDDREGFAAQYTRARDIGLDCRADAAVEDAKAAKDGALGRLSFDADRWYLSKMAPKRYGDKVAHVGGGPDDAPIRTESRLDLSNATEEQLRALASIPVQR